MMGREPLRPPPDGGLERLVDRGRGYHRAVDLRAYADDGPLVGLRPPLHYREAAQVVIERRARMAEQATVRVRCGDPDTGRKVLHTIHLEHGRLRLADHPRSELSLAANPPQTGRLPRCLEVLAAWRNAQVAVGRARGSRHGDWRDYTVWWSRWPGEDELPPALRKIRRVQVGQGAMRRDLREWLGQAAMQATNRAGELARLPARLEYSRVRELLLLPAPPARLPITAGGLGDPRALGWTFDEYDDDDVDEGGQMRWRAGISLTLGRDWLRRVYWAGLAVVDGRLLLDVEHDPHGRLIAVLIDWGGRYSGMGDEVTTPGDITATDTPLTRDAAGRWHLADPTVGTQMHRRPARLQP